MKLKNKLHFDLTKSFSVPFVGEKEREIDKFMFSMCCNCFLASIRLIEILNLHLLKR